MQLATYLTHNITRNLATVQCTVYTCLFVSRVRLLYAYCLIVMSIFAEFPNVVNLLYELPCRDIHFGDPDLIQ